MLDVNKTQKVVKQRRNSMHAHTCTLAPPWQIKALITLERSGPRLQQSAVCSPTPRMGAEGRTVAKQGSG